MIIVTGTKRSGTSMWMQTLRAGGIPIFGEAFPRDWGESIRDANPEGFYESMLRQGIYYQTNPHPVTGYYVAPEQVVGWGVKVFIPGVIRSDRAYMGRVLASMRNWREYTLSLRRLHAMEQEKRAERLAAEGKEPPAAPPYMPPELEWWNENFCLVRDVVTRRYAFHFVSYDRVLEHPRITISEVFGWLGKGDADAAAETVKATLRTQAKPELETDLPARITDVFDAFYEHVHEQRPLDGEFVERLNEANAELAPRIREHQQRLAVFGRRRQAAMQQARAAARASEE